MTTLTEAIASLPAVEVMYDFTAGNSCELTVHKGQLLRVVTRDTANWWTLHDGVTSGKVPSTYVKVLHADAAPAESASASDDDDSWANAMVAAAETREQTSTDAPAAPSRVTSEPAVDSDDEWANQVIAANTAASVFSEDDSFARHLVSTGSRQGS